jgi:hypothetical protein
MWKSGTDSPPSPDFSVKPDCGKVPHRRILKDRGGKDDKARMPGNAVKIAPANLRAAFAAFGVADVPVGRYTFPFTVLGESRFSLVL